MTCSLLQCDENQPACSRCIRLNLVCVGSGQQRYKFKHHNQNAQVVPFSKERKARMAAPSMLWSNDFGLMLSAFISSINPLADFRYNLWFNFGIFLEDVPRRLGHSEALDQSAIALTSAHAHFCTGRAPTVEILAKYSAALRALRVGLNDAKQAHSPNTLCAVRLLLICTSFIGRVGSIWSGHAEGAAHILRARGNFGPRDDFEGKLLLSLRGSVVRCVIDSPYARVQKY